MKAGRMPTNVTFPILKKRRRRKSSPAGDGQRQPRVRNRVHLEVVARLPSAVSAILGVHVCHIRYADRRFGKRETGKGEKPSDCWVLPLTPSEHMGTATSQHSMRETVFWDGHGIDATALARDLYAVWEKTSSKLEAEEMMSIILGQARYERSAK